MPETSALEGAESPTRADECLPVSTAPVKLNWFVSLSGVSKVLGLRILEGPAEPDDRNVR